MTDKLHWSKTRAKFDAATARASKGIKETANVGQLMSVNVEPEDIAGTGAALGDDCKITVGDGVDAPMNSMAGGALEAIGGEMKIAKINVGGNAETELNDASLGTKAQKVSMTATKNNANGVVYDSLPPTNDAALDCLDCPAREECTFGTTGNLYWTNICKYVYTYGKGNQFFDHSISAFIFFTCTCTCIKDMINTYLVHREQ